MTRSQRIIGGIAALSALVALVSRASNTNNISFVNAVVIIGGSIVLLFVILALWLRYADNDRDDQ